MYRHLVAAGLVALSFTSVVAQEQGGRVAEKSAPITKLEAFSTRTGTVLIKGFKEVGQLGGTGLVIVEAREFRDASKPKAAGQYGVTIQVKEAGRLERENTSYVDEDELDSLIKGIEYISKIDRTVTALADFEAQFRTRGDFSVTVFSSASGSKLAVSSGHVREASAFLNLEDAAKLKELLIQSKQVIASAKSASASGK